METYNWSSFSKRVNIKASIAEVYAMWATPGGLEKWFLRLAEFTHADGNTLYANDSIQPGDSYRWRWFGWPDSMEEKGKVLAANGYRYDKIYFR